jgi:dihydroxyacetone kinase-like predicted kinase
MLGARGNSGVILSQLFRAQCEVLKRRGSEGSLAPNELGLVLSRASELAYRAVANPVQGTMLSVLAAAAAAPQSPGLGDYLGGVVDAAETALAATPDQLPILREAGVVDSGGYGLLLLLRGWYESLCGQPAPAISRSLLGLERAQEQAAHGGGHPADLIDNRERAYGYCVTLLVDAPGANEDELRRRLRELGDSVLVAAMGGRLKLHVHVPDPEPVRALASELGAIAGSDITNIDEQTAVATRPSLPLVAVAAGEGLSRVFRSLGAGVVAGGPGRNPNTADDGNVIAAARQAAASREGIVVVPTRSLPQGIAATLAYHAEDSAQANAARMQQAAEGVVSAELVGASRAATLHGIHVEAGQTMVLLEGKLLGVEDAGLAALVERRGL